MLIQIEDESVVYEFDGELIAGPVSTRLDPKDRQRARWFVAELYRKAAGKGYVYYQVNYSTVWHCLDGASHVRKPLTVSRDELPERAVYCGVLPARAGREHCPSVTLAEARRMTVPDLVVTEAPQVRITRLPDPAAVFQRLIVANQRSDGGASAAMSAPMRELLAQAASNDPAFRTAAKPVVTM